MSHKNPNQCYLIRYSLAIFFLDDSSMYYIFSIGYLEQRFSTISFLRENIKVGHPSVDSIVLDFEFNLRSYSSWKFFCKRVRSAQNIKILISFTSNIQGVLELNEQYVQGLQNKIYKIVTNYFITKILQHKDI